MANANNHQTILTCHSEPSVFLGNTIEEKTRTILGWTDGYTPSCSPGSTQTVCISNSQPPLKMVAPMKKDRSRKARTPQKSAPYPYSLLPGEGRSRKSSVSSVSSSDSISKQQLTPPPSPATTSSTNNANVTIVSLPRTASTRMVIPNDSKPPAEGSCYNGCLPISPVSPNTPNPYRNIQKSAEPRGRGPSQQVFERIRELIPNVPADKNAYRILVQTATSVIELEHKLENIIQEKEKYRSMLENRRQQIHQSPSLLNCRMASFGQTTTPAPHPFNPVLGAPINPASLKDCFLQNTARSNVTGRLIGPMEATSCSTVPDDLLHVDVSAFKCLVTSPNGINTETTMCKGTNSYSSQWEGSFPGGFDLDLVAGSSNSIDSLTVDTAASFC